VISLKSKKTVLREIVFDVVFNAVFIRLYKTAAKVHITRRTWIAEIKFFSTNIIIAIQRLSLQNQSLNS